MSAPKQIIELVERFENNIDEYRAGRYNETELRRDFVDPFFKALGWDVDNKKGYTEMYREVVHEDAMKVKGSNKAPDYGFYLGCVRKFFVEAKKPSVNLENDVRAAFQLRSYAWSANLPISILTDFEEFAIYDCRVEPSNSDSPKIARLKHFTYDKYVDNWDRIVALFSREAVLNGSLAKYIESTKRKKNTLTVDEAFLKEIDHWREILVQNIHLNNSELNIRQLNSAVQNTIDRIVFLRICEDRGIERDGRLKALLNGEKSIYRMLCEQFQQADEKYNSGLFYFKKESLRHVEPDELALCLNIDDAVLREIIEELYPPKSPYRFSVIPAEILGHVYEQFLGKVISLTEDHQIKVEYKPEVRKAGGVYYTPTYIVDYIVENTVGKLLEGRTPNSASGLRILDLACGSGSFLIGAYQYLLDWHLKWYIDHILPLIKVGKTTSSKAVKDLLSEDYKASTKKRGRVRPKKGVPETTNHFPIYEVKTDEWRLTTAERKRILLNNIYGVDIDHQATEVTKLSLQLKVLEGENEGTIIKQLKISQERALPDLEANIKCGNSLIGNDFPQTNVLTEDEMYRINLFEWKTEFSEVFEDGGFDAIIGNPPYIQIQKLKEFYPAEILFYQSNYKTAKEKNVDIYVPFIEQGLSLLKKDGFLGYICPNRFFNSEYGILLRQYLKRFDIYHLVNFRHYFVFKNADTYTCLLFIQNKKQQNKLKYKEIRNLYKNNDEQISRYLNTYQQSKGNLVIDEIEPNFAEQEKWHFMTKKERTIFEKISKHRKFSDCYDINFQGLITGKDDIYIMELVEEKKTTRILYSRILKKEVELESLLTYHIVGDRDISRYHIEKTKDFILFPYKNGILIPKDELRQEFPLTWNYLSRFEPVLRGRENGKFNCNEWYQYSRNQAIDKQNLPKILIPHVVQNTRVTYDKLGNEFIKNVGVNGVILSNSINEDVNYFLGVLNSNMASFFISRTSICLSGGYYATNKQFAGEIPIRIVDFSKREEKQIHDDIVNKVDLAIGTKDRISQSTSSSERNMFERQYKSIESQINYLVNKLYEIDDDEHQIILESIH